MKYSSSIVAWRRLLPLASLTLMLVQIVWSQAPLFRHPQAGDVYKEFTRGMNSYADWRVIDPNAPNADAQSYLPNRNLAITIDDLADAIRAEALIDIGMWHYGTYGKAINFNSKGWIPISELQTTPGPSAPECYIGSTIATVDVPLGHLVEGTNRFQGRNAGQSCYNFGWGQYGQFGIVIRVYYKSSKPHPTGTITSPSNSSTLGENPRISVSTSGSVSRVNVVGYYDGFDTDGDGVYRDWHYNYHKRKTETDVTMHDHIGTVNSAPYSLTWNTTVVPDQGSIKLQARIRGTNGVWYVTPEVSGLTLRRSNATVKIYKAIGVPPRFTVRKGGSPKTCTFSIPTSDNLSSATSAKMLITQWNGTNKQALPGETGYTRINSYTFPLFGADENWSYDARDFPTSALKSGTNTFTVYSNSTGFGLYISWPGPALVVRYGGAPPPPGGATQLAFQAQPSNTSPGSTISPPVTVRIEDASGNLVAGETRQVTIAIGSNPSGGTLSGTKTVSAAGGIATFSGLSINNAGNGYTLVATASSLAGATSNPFNITSGTTPPPPPPTGNIVVNGGFEDGTTGWRHFANGGSTNAFSVVGTAPIAEGTKKARVILDPSIGTNNQFYLMGLTLEAGTQYRLTFQAYASKATTIQARVIEQDDDYTTYGFPFRTFSLTTGWQTFTVDFTAQNFAGTVSDGMLQFYFVNSSPSTSLYFDAVSISSGSTPPPPPPPPPTGNIVVNGGFEDGTTGWRHFANGGSTNAFSVVGTAPIAEGTKKARVILDPSIGTNNQFYLMGLTLEAGTQYRLTFQAYASKATTIQARVIEQDDDYTTYGFPFRTFSLTTGWQTFTVDFTAQNFAGTVSDGMLQFYFVNSSPSTSLYFDAVSISSGSTPPPPPPPPPTGNIVVNGGFEDGTTGWRHFANGGSTNAFSVVGTAPIAEGTKKARVILDPSIGTNNQVYLMGLTLEAGTQYRLTFQAYASKATTIQARVIEQDDDYTTYGFPFRTFSLTTGWQTFTVDFTAQNFAGTVSDGMLQFYFVNSSPSTSLYFDAVSISSGSTPPPTSNLLQNGGFEGGTSAWQHYANGGSTNAFSVVGTAPIAEGTKKARVVLDPSIGTNNQIYQLGFPLTSGTDYTLTFNAYASTATTLQVRVIEQDDDYTTYGFPFKTISLGTSFQAFAVDFTASNFVGTVNDAMLQFYFVNSSPSTTIYFDKVVIGPAAASSAGSAPIAENAGEGLTPELAQERSTLPSEMGLQQNYPNPFNPSTEIAFALPAPSHVILEVYNVLGERVAVLVDETRPAGYFSARFDAGQLPSGIYFYRLTTNTSSLIKKMMFVK